MPLPIILGIAAGVAGITGIGTGISGAVKMKDANETQKSAQRKHERSQENFKKSNSLATSAMDLLGELELQTMQSFKSFSDMLEKIHNKPDFKKIIKNGVALPEFSPEAIKEVSIGAGVVLGGLGGAAAGTAGGIAAAGATTAAVMALGTASTGTAIASLSGAAATNATLAALGGGAIAAGGGGIALGTTILGASTLGVGFLVGGIIFNATGSKLSEKADEAYWEACKEENQVNKICEYLNDLTETANSYRDAMQKVKVVYEQHLSLMNKLIYSQNKTDWNRYSAKEKQEVENTYLLVAILYKMCKVQLVLKSDTEDETNIINKQEINTVTRESEDLLYRVA